MFDWVAEPQAWIALGTLAILEIVLGIDNIVFISILTGRLPERQRATARRVGLALAMGIRILLLVTLSMIMRLDAPLCDLLGTEVSGRDLILLAGGLFLIAKSTVEIHHRLEEGPGAAPASRATGFAAVLVQITLLDAVFSLDSVITAVGMARHLAVMVLAVVISVCVMILFVNAVCDFVERHPAFKMLALSFLLLIGVTLVGEAFEMRIPKGYIYFAMGFSLSVEMLNLRIRRASGPDISDRPGP